MIARPLLIAIAMALMILNWFLFLFAVWAEPDQDSKSFFQIFLLANLYYTTSQNRYLNTVTILWTNKKLPKYVPNICVVDIQSMYIDVYDS